MQESWLLTLILSAALGGLAGLGSSLAMHQKTKKDRLKDIAAALWADLQRVKQELGEPADTYLDFNVYGQRSIPPQIHKWTEGLIPELGQIKPQLVVDFFHLERALHNFGASMSGWRASIDQLHLLEEQETAAREEREESDDIAEGMAEEMLKKLEVRRKKENLGKAADLMHHSVVTERKRAWCLMDRIESDLLPHLPSKREITIGPKLEAGDGR